MGPQSQILQALRWSLQPHVALFILFFHKTLFSLNKSLIIETKSSSAHLIKNLILCVFLYWDPNPAWSIGWEATLVAQQTPTLPNSILSPSVPLFNRGFFFFHPPADKEMHLCLGMDCFLWVISFIFFSQGRKNKHFLDGMRLFICHY